MPRKPRAWVLLSPETIPERWRGRATTVSLVPLLPREAQQLLREGRVMPEVPEQEEAVARLAARGLKASSIARMLGVSPRTVHRRIARLRERLGIGSSTELAAELARRGF